MDYFPPIIAILIVIAACCLLFRIAFPKSSSAGIRILCTALVCLGSSSAIHEAFLAIYRYLQHLRTEGESPALLRLIDDFPFSKLFVAYLILTLFVRAVLVVQNGMIRETFGKLSPKARLNGIVVIIFFAGIYLCIASLCTIPALQVNQPFTDEERSQIVTQIDASTLNGDAFDRQFPDALAFNDSALSGLRVYYEKETGEHLFPACLSSTTPSAQISSAVATSQLANKAEISKSDNSGGDNSAKASATADSGLMRDVREVLSNHDNFYCSRVNQYRNTRSTVRQIIKDQAENAKNQVNSNFAIRLTGRDRADYLFSLKSNVGELASTLQTTLARCKASAENDEGDFARVAGVLQQRIQSGSQKETPENLDSIPIPLGYFLNREVNGACSLENISWRTQTIAPSPQLGVFTLFFGWLEDSDSLALATLCGMLGVGLTGAIVTSFVRQGKIAPGEPWIVDAFPVVARGFTAAIVVYLTIEGGLNIFAAGANQPNPYVLLFSCLVGAVFSEDVWISARKRLQGDSGSGRTADPDDHEIPEPDSKHAEAERLTELRINTDETDALT